MNYNVWIKRPANTNLKKKMIWCELDTNNMIVESTIVIEMIKRSLLEFLKCSLQVGQMILSSLTMSVPHLDQISQLLHGSTKVYFKLLKEKSAVNSVNQYFFQRNIIEYDNRKTVWVASNRPGGETLVFIEGKCFFLHLKLCIFTSA